MLNLISSKARFVRIAHSHTPGKMKFQHQGRILVGCHIAASPVDVSSDFSEFAVKAEFSSRRVGSGLGRGEGFFIVVMSVSPAIRLSYLAATRPLLAPTLTASTCARAPRRGRGLSTEFCHKRGRSWSVQRLTIMTLGSSYSSSRPHSHHSHIDVLSHAATRPVPVRPFPATMEV